VRNQANTRKGNDNPLRAWAREVQPYVKNLEVFKCPSATPQTDAPNRWNPVDAPGAGNTSYHLNGVAATKSLAAIPAPADIIYLQESDFITRSCQERPRLVTSDGVAVGAR
jgi:hypothetical protein